MNGSDSKWDDSGLIEEIEEFLKNSGMKSVPDQITEYPKLRYKPKIGWYRKCHRCYCCQITRALPVEFKPMQHMCVRDITLKSIFWGKYPK